MKKIVSTILLCLLLAGSVLSLASCDKILLGEYEADIVVADVTYEFGLFGKVTYTYDPIVGDDTVKVGTYKISDDGEKITLTYEGEDPETYSVAMGEENGVSYVKIGVVKYEKED